jgi:hypothetical protein
VFGSIGKLDVQLRVKAISKEKKFLGLNEYTDRPKYQDAWLASFVNDGLSGGMQQVDLYYPNAKEANMWSFAQVYSPLDMLRVFRIIVTFYPEADYVATEMTEGFFDAQGYHAPGVYPAGHYGAGYYTGQAISLSPSTPVPGIHKGWIFVNA